MNFTAVPIIVICCYLCGEIYKAIFRNHTNAYRFIPLVTSVLGGILGVVIFLTNPEVMLMYGKEASNRKQEIDRQHYTIPNQRPKDKHCGKI